MNPFVVVHCGAGRHSDKNVDGYKRLCRKALKRGIELLSSQEPEYGAHDVAVEVCRVLEDSVLTNAGVGSNLNYDGEVETDASIIDSSTMCGTAVAAVSDVANPVLLASHLHQAVQGKKRGEERSLPLFLCGQGASEYAAAKGLKVDGALLITEKSRRAWAKWRPIIDAQSSEPTQDPSPETKEIEVNDTVGVICGDRSGTICAASSSGGTLLKPRGRVGPAAVIGAATDILRQQDETIIAVVASGNGEDLLRSRLASRACHEIDTLESVLTGSQPIYAGFLALARRQDTKLELYFTHTTESFIFGQVSLRNTGPSSAKVVHSVCQSGQKIASGGWLV